MSQSQWIFAAGSVLHGTQTQNSDVDVLVVSKFVREEGKAPEPFRFLNGKTPIDIRTATPRQLATATIAGEKWAWETWSKDAAPDCRPSPPDVHRALSDALVATSYHKRCLPNWYVSYKDKMYREAVAEFPLEAADYRAWFELAGWHCKIGYYLSLAALFVEAWPEPIPRNETEFLIAVKEGKTTMAEWRSKWEHQDAKAMSAASDSVDEKAFARWIDAFLEAWSERS